MMRETPWPWQAGYSSPKVFLTFDGCDGWNYCEVKVVLFCEATSGLRTPTVDWPISLSRFLRFAVVGAGGETCSS